MSTVIDVVVMVLLVVVFAIAVGSLLVLALATVARLIGGRRRPDPE